MFPLGLQLPFFCPENALDIHFLLWYPNCDMVFVDIVRNGQGGQCCGHFPDYFAKNGILQLFHASIGISLRQREFRLFFLRVYPIFS